MGITDDVLANPHEIPEPYEYDSCPQCDDEGYVVAECFEDTCNCLDPELEHDLIPCSLCKQVPQ